MTFLKTRIFNSVQNTLLAIIAICLCLIVIKLYTPSVYADDSLNNQKELISLMDYFADKDLTDTTKKQELQQYTLEKCSALSFVFIGGDSEIFDLGDAFFVEATALGGKDNRQVVYDNIQKYGREYINHFDEHELPEGNLLTELMKDDLELCVDIYQSNNYEKKYEGWKDPKFIED